MGYTCFKCHLNFPGTRELIYHLRFHHAITNHDHLICFQDGCMQTFRLMNSLSNHIRRFHPIPNENGDDMNDDQPHVGDEQNREPEENNDDEENSGPDDTQGDLNEGRQQIDFDKDRFKHEVANFILQMRSSATFTMTAMSDVMDKIHLLLEHSVGALKEQVLNIFEQNAIDTDSEEVRNLLDGFNTASNPFEGLESACQQSKYFVEHLDMVKPVAKALGTRYDQYFDKTTGTVKQKLVTETFQYIPLLATLKQILNNPTVRHMINNEQINDQLMTSYRDGLQYQHHGLFVDHPNALRIQLYYDDIEVVNPLGSKKSIHKLGMFYYSIENLPRAINSNLRAVHLLAVCYAQDLKKYGFKPILQQIKNEIKELESDGGHVFDLDIGPTCMHGTLTSVVGDTLAIHDLFGFLSPSADRLCRRCMATRESIQTQFYEDQFELRTIEKHDEHVTVAEQMPRGNPDTGVRTGCILNDMRYFHTANSHNFDIMHDILEGVAPYEVKLVLKQLIIVDQFLTLTEFNQRVKSFSYDYCDIKNKPSGITRMCLVNINDRKLGQKAIQMWCLVRSLTFLIGDKVPSGNQYYNFLLLLRRCMDIIFAPDIRKGQALYLKHLTVEHHATFKELFPEERLINKHHHMIHYPLDMVMCGPLINYACLKYEMKHNYSKQVGHVNCNFRNIPLSVANKHQLLHAAVWSGIDRISCAIECRSGDVVKLEYLQGSATITQRLDLDRGSDVFVASEVKVFGTSYTPHLYVITGMSDGKPVVGYITAIVVLGPQAVHFVLKRCSTLEFVPHFHAYPVTVDDPPDFTTVEATELKDYVPHSGLHTYDTDDTQTYISLRTIIN